MGIQITVTIADDQLDALASKIADAVLNAAPGLIESGADAPPAPVEGDQVDASTGADPAPSTGAAGDEPSTGVSSDVSTGASTSSAPENQTPGYAGAVIDPITHMAVEPGHTVQGDDAADPAPAPADAPPAS